MKYITGKIKAKYKYNVGKKKTNFDSLAALSEEKKPYMRYVR